MYCLLLKDILVETKVLQFLSARLVEVGGLTGFSPVYSQVVSVFIAVSR